MRDFEYEAPGTMAEAVAVLNRHQANARVLAGGTDLIDHIRVGRLTPGVVVDIKGVPEVNILELSPTGLRLGAAVPCYRIYKHPGLGASYSALVDSVSIIGGIQIQSRASVGGNLCTSGPAADSTPSLIVLEAQCVIAGPQGARSVPVEQFCTGPGQNVLKPGEFLVEFQMPARGARSGSHYLRFIPRNEMDIAVVGAAASVELDESGDRIVSARIALGAVAPTPLIADEAGAAVAGQPVSAATLDRAAEAARAIARPIDDMRGTVEFRKHVTGVLVRRALEKAIERARER